MEYDFDTGLLEKQAEEMAKKGMQQYSDFCHNHISRIEFMHLKDSGHHETFKSIAQDVDNREVDMSLLDKHQSLKNNNKEISALKDRISELENQKSRLMEALNLSGKYIEYISKFLVTISRVDSKKIEQKSEEFGRKIKNLL